MKLNTSAAVAALVTGLAAPALALDFGDGFYATGEFELEYLDGSGLGTSGETLAYGEVDIGFEQEAGGIGAFIGFDAFSFDNDDEVAVYGALTYSGSFGKIQIGVPRAALEDYIETPDLGGSALLDLELSPFNGSFLPLSYLANTNDTPVGLRYDGSFGAAKVGVSYHSFNDADIVDAAVNYQLGQVELRAGLENISGSGFSETSYFIGAEGEFAQVVAGLMYGNIGVLGDTETVQLYATYSPIDALDLTATYVSISNMGTSEDLYGIAANYTFSQGIYVEAGYVDGNAFGGELYNASLGVKF